MHLPFLLLFLLAFTGSQGLHRDCKDPIDPGRGRAAFRRFAYDADAKGCRSFIWGGCNANKNNFETLEECQAKCEHGRPQCSIA
ncbi:Trypsin inhibitor [Echinococcus granulosus]|uniref:Trypsin inhibitor n=1 Tax=Echinococcus granulosus TaxID=6210 RepID=W6UA19_ECHGR|nr:Trypsin inhibitor [Echinococcus granulosus]EUB57880.1 Trypsin inhibitor [Echinococcus granulosus]